MWQAEFSRNVRSVWNIVVENEYGGKHKVLIETLDEVFHLPTWRQILTLVEKPKLI